jgi:poly(hydroxyalkanoate) depolymerase family esterase
MRYGKLLRASFALQRSMLEAWAPATSFIERTYRNRAGLRHYRVYTPRTANARPLPLVVMLHGCSQSAGNFAAATRMNALAEELGFVVVYPEQSSRANSAKCWNWFEALHQRRNEGEPSLIAGITRRLLRQGLDARRVYVAGLSAGGAMAAVMGAEYPDLYAAVGIHSGLSVARAATRSIPIIAFHGDQDTIVHPRNCDFVRAPGSRLAAEQGTRNGRPFTRTMHFDAGGRPVVEQWLVHGAGHAWFGGNPGAPFADPRGPDASREMLRFFLSHTR